MIIEEAKMKEANAVTSPGEDEKRWEEEENKKEMEGVEATRFRAVAARCNYLSQDRPDIMYA
eukprot:1990528-Karenia_brevis.AAC.1